MTRPAITTLDAEGLRAAALVLRDVLQATSSLTDAAAVRAMLAREADIAEAILANAGDEDAEEAQEGLADAVADHLAQAGDHRNPPASTRVAPSAPAPESGQPAADEARRSKYAGRWTPERRARQSALMKERRGIETPWTPERLKLLREGYPTRNLLQLLSEINNLPGPPFRTVDSLRYRADEDGLKRDPEAALVAKRAAVEKANAVRLGRIPAAQPAPDDGTPPDWDEQAQNDARSMFWAGKGARDLSNEFGGALAWWQAWCERERAGDRRAA